MTQVIHGLPRAELIKRTMEEDFGGCAWHFTYSQNCDACRIRAGQERKYQVDERDSRSDKGGKSKTKGGGF